MEINEATGEVIAHGTLTFRYDKHGFESNPASYVLSFESRGGYLRLKEFEAVSKPRTKAMEKKS